MFMHIIQYTHLCISEVALLLQITKKKNTPSLSLVKIQCVTHLCGNSASTFRPVKKPQRN